MKVKILKLSIFVSVVMLLATIYGLDRYLLLHFTKPIYENYPLLEKASSNSKVVVLLVGDYPTKACIHSLLDQTVKVDEISYNTRNDVLNNVDYPILTVYSVSKNRDLFTPTLFRERDVNTKILFLDSSSVYGAEYIEKMVSSYTSEPVYGNLKNKIKGGVIFTQKNYNSENVESIDYFFTKKGKDLQFEEIFHSISTN